MEALRISVVSHGQGALVGSLLGDIDRVCNNSPIRVTLTLNVPEVLPFGTSDFSFPIQLIENKRPQGFSRNHNAAFHKGSGEEYFCVINPDVRVQSDVFSVLLPILAENPGYGVIAPLVRGPEGGVEDSARKLPTPWRILRKAFRPHPIDYEIGQDVFFPEWIAGMFMLFRSRIFREIGGFDERFFLYYEDVNIGCRLRLAGYRVVLCPRGSIVHDARRASHGSIRYMRWHIGSMGRFFLSLVFLRCLWLRLKVKAPRQL